MHTDVAVLVILVAVAGLLIASQFIRVPYPILLVLGGLGLAFFPDLPEVELEPEVVLVAVLPPLLYSAAYFTPLRELRRNVKPITALAIGLVLATMVGVACVAHAALDFGWAEAFVLGAIVSPTDPVAATAIAHRLNVPNRIVAIIEGESLINDGTALVAFKFAVAAVVTGTFSLVSATGDFFVTVIGGIAVGIAVGAAIAWVRRRINEPPVEVTIALFSGFFGYLPAEALGVSGVLAAVTVGIYMGRLTSVLTTPTTRIQGQAVWEIVQFLLNSALFVLVGLQLPQAIDGLESLTPAEAIRGGLLIAGTVIVVRLLWVFPITYLPRMLTPNRPRRGKPLPWRGTLVVGWTGMRGAVSLAAALAVPLTIDGGGDFPHREEIIFLTFAVILVTLLVQGLSLPWLIESLGIDRVDDGTQHEENIARKRAAKAALDRLEELSVEDWVREDTVERVGGAYRYRYRRFSARFDDDDGESVAIEERSEHYQRLARELLEAQRATVIEMRNSGEINDDVLRIIERELDLEDSRLEI